MNYCFNCDDISEIVPSSMATFKVSRAINPFPAHGSVQDWKFQFICSCPLFNMGTYFWLWSNKLAIFKDPPPDTCQHIKLAWRSTVIAYNYWNTYKQLKKNGYLQLFIPPDKLCGPSLPIRRAILIDQKLRKLDHGVGHFICVPTLYEIQEFNIITHYRVVCNNMLWTCECKGFYYHKHCKHISTIIFREKKILARRVLGISLALLVIQK